MFTPPTDPADEPEAVARFLAEPLGALWHALDGGRALADEFFAETEDRTADERPNDAHLWAHLVRYQTATTLRAIEAEDWKSTFKHNSSIKLQMDPFTVLVCKAAGDGPQSPGRNRSRTDFFQQLGLFATGGDNFILYWMVRDDELQMGLCKPKGLWPFRGKPKLEWKRPIAFDPLAGLIFPSTDADDDFGGLFRPGEEEGGGEAEGSPGG